MSVKATATSLRRLAEIPVREVRRIGDKRAGPLADLGITTVLDLVTHYPRRYIDRTRRADVADMQLGEESLVLATVEQVSQRRTRHGRPLVQLEVDDGTGRLRVVFFNQAWRAKQVPVGTEALFFGKLDHYKGGRQFTNPVVDLVGSRTGRIVPVYPTSERSGIAGWEFGDWVAEALRRAGTLEDPLPERWRDELGLIGRGVAFAQIHGPSSFSELDRARRRLAFDELLRLQLEVLMRREAAARDALAIRHQIDPPPGAAGLVESFVKQLPFALTDAQRRAVELIREDLAGPLPMHRLLQGDVGAGKTVVAVCALLTAVQGSHQGALMAPTEVLAEQHFLAVRALLADLSVPDTSRLGGDRPLDVKLLTNRTGSSERARLHDGLRSGSVDIVVGTHALLTEDVRFHSLGVVVIDEQHRFGVEQRAALRAKGRDGADGAGADPDLLVMTATPIPRTAAMVVFGDLDIVELDELPAGRAPVRTMRARTEEDEQQAWERVRDEVGAGHCAFIVCPLVEGSERIQARSATEERERLASGVLSGLTLGLLHGQLKASEKEGVMAAFRRGETQVLVATTVIEVGVDVPEATVMVVEDAERFGIAQLHQLRGRVGRSDLPSWCYLFGGSRHETRGRARGLLGDTLSGRDPAQAADARLEALVRTTDGFELAEIDLEIRGEGTILGARQKGRSDLKLASLRRDRPLVEEARRVAEELLEEHPALGELGSLAEEIRLFIGEEEADYLLKS
ncbi:MAG: ATP-dependent DNA helicase RecG [Acidimicrobiales bacterium]